MPIFNSQRKARRLLEEAVSREQKGEYNEAHRLLEKSIEQDPRCGPAYNLLAWIFAINNYQLDQAVQYAGKAIGLANNPNELANSYDTLAEIYGRQGYFDAAIQEFGRCLNTFSAMDQMHPNYSPSFRIALCYLAKQDVASINKAVGFLKQALLVNPSNPVVYSAMGDGYLALESYASALYYYPAAIDRAHTWNFNFPAVSNNDSDEWRRYFLSVCWCSKGVAYYYLGQYESCRRSNEEAYNAYASLPHPLINLAGLAARDGEQPTMRQLLEAGVPLINLQRDANLVTFMLIDTSFSRYRDVVLDLLLNYGKITRETHVQCRKAWLERRSEEEKPPNVTNYIGKFTGAASFAPTASIATHIKEEKNMGRQYNAGRDIHSVEGDQHVTGGYYSTEGDINVGAMQNEADLISELEKLKAELVKAADAEEIDEATATFADHQMTKAIQEAQEDKTDKSGISDHLRKAKASLEGISAVANISNALMQAIRLVQQM